MKTGRIIMATLAGHFVASFTALGMPPFYDRILHQLGNTTPWLAGGCFVGPTLIAALSNGAWGKLADRFGKKRLLLRAHLGLAVSLWLTGHAANAWQFCLALLLQGLLGGTFAASNAYLATVVSGHRLTRLLTLMQGSARAALFAGPALMGLLTHSAEPIRLYRILALLPLASAFLIWRLPATETPAPSAESPSNVRQESGSTPLPLYGLQFAFIFGTVVTFPYFVSAMEHALGQRHAGAAGFLFGLPHLVYLLCAFPLSRPLGRRHLPATLAVGLFVLAVSFAGQFVSHSFAVIVAWRMLTGLGMTVAYIALHGLIAETTHARNAGRRFGAIESSTKWGTVAAGLTASALITHGGPQAPFLAGSLVLALALFPLAGRLVRQSRGRFPNPAALPVD
jgi:MFS family permease